MRCTVIFDVGKTHTKLSLWTATGELVARRSRANARGAGSRPATLDVAGIEAWGAATLREFATLGHVGTIIPVGHGAAAALVRDGRLACEPLDYETSVPADVRSRYDSARDEFSHSGSPALPNGLNLGAQLHWLEESNPALAGADVSILPWAQYWAYRLSGVAASEVTSLGCHTDLWDPRARAPAALAIRRGWAARLAPLRRADEILGPLRRDWVDRTGLAGDVQVLCGLHDSNAALLAARGFPEIGTREATVMSTGTWFVAMRTPGPGLPEAQFALPEDRDCLLNVDAYGNAIPSARFMGGRELELLDEGHGGGIDDSSQQADMLEAAHAVVANASMVLPTLMPGCGPYPRASHRWLAPPAGRAARGAAAALYAALVARAALTLIGARERILVEGRFAQSRVFVGALAALLPETAVYVSDFPDGVPYGAMRLVDPALPPPGVLRRADALPIDLRAYAAAWQGEAERLDRTPVP